MNAETSNKTFRSYPDDWKIDVLGKHINVIGGGTPRTTTEEFWNGEIPWISVVDFAGGKRWISETEKYITKEGLENSSTKILHKGQIIISARGTVGELAQVSTDMAFNQSCYGIEGRSTLDNDFLFYILKLKIKEIQQKGHGAVFNTITRQTFNQILVPLPNIDEQKAIAKIMSDIDYKIVLNNRMNDLFEKLGRVIFKRWFVDFEFPNQEGKPYKSAGGKMESAQVGEIPEHWEIKPLGDMTDAIFSGGTPNTQNDAYWTGSFPWLSSGETCNHFITRSNETITQSGIDNSSTRLAKFGDVLIASAGQGKTRGQTSLCFLDSYINQSIIAIRAKDHITTSSFLYFDLSRRYNQLRALSDSNSIRGSLTTRTFKDLEITKPPFKLVSDFDAFVTPILKRIRMNLLQNGLLTKSRDLLLPKLMSGRIRAPLKKVNSEVT